MQHIDEITIFVKLNIGLDAIFSPHRSIFIIAFAPAQPDKFVSLPIGGYL